VIIDKKAVGTRRLSHYAVLEFKIDGQTHQAEVYVSHGDYARFKVGEAVTISVFSFWPSLSASIVAPDIGTPTNVYAVSAVVLILNGVLALVIGIFVGRAIFRRKLARLGTPAIGRVVEKQIKRIGKGRGASYRLHYKFQASSPSGEREFQGMMEVTLKEYNSISNQQDVTVLYDPDRPEDSVIYCFSGYQIVGM
jgi:hypothetical protein